MQLLTVNISGKVQQKTLNGREYLVAPVSMIVPGVLPGSRGPLLYTINEIKRSEFSWSGMPLVLEHPRDDSGNLISARSPDVLEKYQLGFVFNAATRNNRLEGEAWFDVQKTQQMNSGLLASLQNGESLELSTGLLTDNVARKPGVVNGRTYTHEATNFRPDHLAVLLSGPGACSLQDGCGVLVNELGESDVDELSELVANYNAADTTKTFSEWLVANECKCGGKGKDKAVHNEETDEETTTRENTERLGILGNEFGFQSRVAQPEFAFQPTVNNCGIGSGGFQPGNTCGKGGGGSSKGGGVAPKGVYSTFSNKSSAKKTATRLSREGWNGFKGKAKVETEKKNDGGSQYNVVFEPSDY